MIIKIQTYMGSHPGVAQSYGGNPFNAFFVVDEAVLDDSAVTEVCVWTQADITGDEEVWISLTKQWKRFDDWVCVGISVCALLIFWQSVNDTEQKNGA